MKILKQISIICLFSIIGEIISYGIRYAIPKLFIPGALIGMLLLFISLMCKIIKLNDIDTVGDFFVNNMGFFFVPAAVSVLQYLDVLKPIIWQVLAVCLISFIITFVSIALCVKLTLVIQERIISKKESTNGDANV